jgi:hypothetical protein
MEYRKTGIVENQTLIKQEIMELPTGRLVKLNLYFLQLSNEKSKLLYKRDINLPQDIISKVMKYRVSKDGVIYNSTIKK